MKIPVKVYEKVVLTMTVGEVLRAKIRGHLVNEGGTLYIVTII